MSNVKHKKCAKRRRRRKGRSATGPRRARCSLVCAPSPSSPSTAAAVAAAMAASCAPPLPSATKIARAYVLLVSPSVCALIHAVAFRRERAHRISACAHYMAPPPPPLPPPFLKSASRVSEYNNNIEKTAVIFSLFTRLKAMKTKICL